VFVRRDEYVEPPPGRLDDLVRDLPHRPLGILGAEQHAEVDQ